jgi:hypothetical protein
MSIRIVRRIATLASLAACLCAQAPVRAAVPEPEEGAPKPVVADSSRLLPRWLHLHGAAGLGWLASPEWMRKFYQAGQSYEVGLQVRPSGAFRLSLSGEYQTLPAVTDMSYGFITSVPALDTEPTRDTVQVEARATGWIGSARLEAQMAISPELWLMGGFGRGYLSTGLEPVHLSDPYASLDFEFPGSSGWAWIATVGTKYEFELFGPRLSAEVRSSYMMRHLDRFQTWSVRIGWGGR